MTENCLEFNSFRVNIKRTFRSMGYISGGNYNCNLWKVQATPKLLEEFWRLWEQSCILKRMASFDTCIVKL